MVERFSRYLLDKTGHSDRMTNKVIPIYQYAEGGGGTDPAGKIQQATGPHKDLLTVVKRCKLQRYGHVSRSSGLAKTILQGTVKGGRRQGRQRKRWEDIREWTDKQEDRQTGRHRQWTDR